MIEKDKIFAHSRTISPLHLYGEGFMKTGKDLSKVFFVNKITKNASSWLPKVFGGWLYNYIDNTFVGQSDIPDSVLKEFDHPKQHVVFLRDPIERWISGVTTCAFGVQLTELTKNPLWHNNSHLEPQISFLHDMSINETTWFAMNHNFTNTFYHWCDINLESYNRIPEQNTTDQKANKIKDFSKNLKDSVYSNDAILNMLQNLYAEDIELFNSVTFYETR